jgi:hypothetical protein
MAIEVFEPMRCLLTVANPQNGLSTETGEVGPESGLLCGQGSHRYGGDRRGRARELESAPATRPHEGLRSIPT